MSEKSHIASYTLAQVAVIAPAFLFGLIIGVLWALKENS